MPFALGGAKNRCKICERAVARERWGTGCLEEYASRFDPRTATCRAAISGAPETIVRRELDLTIVDSPDLDAS